MRKRIGKNVANGLLEVGTAGEVAAFVRGITPGAGGIPVPGSHTQFGIVAIGNWTPAGGKRFLNDVRRVDAVDVAAGENVERAAEGGVGIKRIDLVGRSGVYVDGEVGRLGQREYGPERNEGKPFEGHESLRNERDNSTIHSI